MTEFLRGLSYARITRIACVAVLFLAGTDIALRAASEFFFPFEKTRNSPGRSDFTEYCHDFLPKEKGTRPRVLLIGDSTMQGLNRRYEETFAYFLSKRFGEIPALKDAQIVNLALGNTTPGDMYLMAEMFRDFEAELVFFVASHRMSGPEMKTHIEYPQFLRRQRKEVLEDEDIRAVSGSRSGFGNAKRAFDDFAEKVWFLARMRYLFKRWWVEEDMTFRLASAFGVKPRVHKPNPSWRVRTETGGMTRLEWYLGMKYAEKLDAGPHHRQYRFVRKCAETLKKREGHVHAYGNPVCLDIYEFASPGKGWPEMARKSGLKMLDAIREAGVTPYNYIDAVTDNEHFADQDHLLAGGNRVFADAVIENLKKVFNMEGGGE